jgi:solute carrier family 50 protein (sugar transporter)
MISDALWWIATIMALGMMASPIPTMLEIYKHKSTLFYSELPYVMAWAQSGAWLLYAHFGRKPEIILVNSVGVLVQSCYILFFFYFSGDRRTFVILSVCFCGFIDASILVFAYMSNSPADMTQYCAMVFNIFMYASPLGVVQRVIETESVTYMPLPLSIASLACALSWFIYGFSLGVVGIIVPNGLGTLLGLAQIVIYFKYANKVTAAPEAEADDVSRIGQKMVVAI